METEKNEEAARVQPSGSSAAIPADGGGCQAGGCCRRGCTDVPRGKLHCFDWLADIPGGMADCDIVEVQFKNTRKGFYRNSTNLDLAIGDLVAVEASPGHDIGTVTLTGQLVRIQMKRANVKSDAEIRTMEEYDQGFGSILYRTTLPELKQPALLTVNDPHDYAQVFVDGKFIGKLDRRNGEKALTIPACKKGATLDILIEAMVRAQAALPEDQD